MTEKKYDEAVIEKLATIKSDNDTNIKFEILSDGEKEKLDSLENEINDFLKNNNDFENYTVEEKDELFLKVHSEMLFDYKQLLKELTFKFELTGLELNMIWNKMHKNIEYNSETLFYGINLKYNLLNTFPKVTKHDIDRKHKGLTIKSTQAIILHHVLSSLTVKGLNGENYSLANVLYYLADVSKVYQYFNSIGETLNKAILEWNLELTKQELDSAKKEVLKDLAMDEIKEVESEGK